MDTREVGPLTHERGFSLVELMVALAIGLILVAGLLTLVIGNLQGYGELSKSGHQMENGRFASQLLRDDLAHAGFAGAWSKAAAPATPPNPCSLVESDLRESLGLPVYGWHASSSAATPPAAWNCLPSAVKPGTDVLVINRVATKTANPAALSAARYYLQASPIAFLFGKTGSGTTFNLTYGAGLAAPIHPLVKHIYFISNCSVCDGGGDGVPTLKRLEYTDAGNWTTPAIALVEGVEQLQLDYGIDDNLDGTVNRFVFDPSSAEWGKVVAVRFNLLARNLEATAGWTDKKKYVLGSEVSASGVASDNVLGPFNDRFKRHVYAMTVRLVNPAGRKEI